ncbi:hypothetical protein ACFRJ1_30585 [Streptomyces sp. NPDC056773]|uniref:hypothetical protein n=1 Tax=unclassified Streptomyces TaxID=2593676 RepID=UPI0020B658C2|nr:hypothetical protein [Streptomyces sp. TBY4]MCP3759417.1 hypothetical protein [Streptomyces sp. TBY4]
MEPHTEATLVPPLAAVPLPRDPSGPAPTPSTDHVTSTSERGSFSLAACTCGWRGPARRSRDLARKDATGHAPQ